MPIPGKGILITSMNIAAEHEDEFNLWYDREHLAERVAIDGFLEARRWVADNANPKYFATYSTAAFEDLSSPAYSQALANQTAWSNTNISRFEDMIRVVGRITHSRGQGRGGDLCVVRLRPDEKDRTSLRSKIFDLMDPAMVLGLISMHLIESDPVLSKSLTEPDKPNPGASDWFILVEGTDLQVLDRIASERFSNVGVQMVSKGTYKLMWDLAKSDL